MNNFSKEIEKYAANTPARFHMPGHKGNLYDYDITELDFSDNLHNPTGIILSLQERCARLYSAQNAFLLVNGSSSGVCAFFVALSLKLGRAPRILMSRDCHKSAMSGAFFSDAQICGVYPENELGGTITPNSIENAILSLDDKPDAIVITSPNYYGMCADTEAIYNIAHKYNALLFVDCAHGAAFPFSKQLPSVPTCDCFVVSTHKTLEALNQSAILLCSCSLTEELKTALSMLQTTSPSYPIMMSIENAMNNGEKYNSHIERIIKFRNTLKNNDIRLISQPPSANDCDITRLCICADNLAEDGYKLSELLKKDNIYVEMADMNCIVCITTPADNDSWYEMLINSLCKIKNNFNGKSHLYKSSDITIDNKFCYTSVKSAFLCKSEYVSFENSVNRSAACPIGVYPPGNSIILPNETITEQCINYLVKSRECGGELFGVKENLIRVTQSK